MLYDFGGVYQYGLYFAFFLFICFSLCFDTLGTVYSIQLYRLSYSLLSGLREHIQGMSLASQIGNPDAVNTCSEEVLRMP
jgi:hypothetical protein